MNSKFGNEQWTPIHTFYENNYTQAVAGLKLYDVLLVNSVIDGMNLVPKEGPIVNTKEGVVVLSESVGAHDQLRKGAALNAVQIAEAMIERKLLSPTAAVSG